MTDRNAARNKSRGMVIVDTCSLINMCEKPTILPKKESFLDSLTYLAQHGFTIVIPEFVVIEITNKCPTRELEDIVNANRKTPLNHAQTRRTFLDFLEKNKDHIVIEKAKPTDRSGNPLPYFEVCRLMREAVEMAKPGYETTHEIPKNYNRNPREYWNVRILSNIRAAMNITSHNPDLGEINCFRVLLDQIIEEHQSKPNERKTPIFLLSDDFTSSRTMVESFAAPFKKECARELNAMKHPPILNFLSVAGFFRALAAKKGSETSILKRMGYNELPQDILHSMFKDEQRFNQAFDSSNRDIAVLTENPTYTPPFPFETAIGNLRYSLDQDATKNWSGSMAGRHFDNGTRPGKR